MVLMVWAAGFLPRILRPPDTIKKMIPVCIPLMANRCAVPLSANWALVSWSRVAVYPRIMAAVIPSSLPASPSFLRTSRIFSRARTACLLTPFRQLVLSSFHCP